MNDVHDPQARTRSRRRWRRFGAFSLLAFLLAASSTALARGWWGGHGCHRGHGAHGGLSEEEVQERVDWVTERVLDEIEATEEQAAEVRAVIADALPKLHAQRARGRELHTRVHEALGAETLDHAALEALRAEAVQVAEAASKEVLGAVTRLAGVLTAEQRQELLERMESFRH